MSLKGSLQTVALPEVLHFLSSTGKSGEFHVSGPQSDGHLWFDEGRIAGFRAGSSAEAFEAIFELMRIGDAEFTFAAGVECPEDVCRVDAEAGQVDPAVEAAQVRLDEWNQIVSVVPSAGHVLTLNAAVPTKVVRLDPEQWTMVVAVSSGNSVGDVIESLSLREFEGFRAVRDLVKSSLVEVSEPVGAAVEEPVSEWEEPVSEWVVESVAEPVTAEELPVIDEPWAHAVEAPAEWEQVASEPVTEEDAAAAVDDENAISGSLLRFGLPAEPVEDGGQHFASYEGDDSGSEVRSGDHYAALRAAMVEVGEDLVPYEGAGEEGSAQVYQFGAEHDVDGRAALQALLSEVTDGADDGHAGEAVDGLADRGPWTQHELSSMDHQGEWRGEEETSNIVPFAPVHAHAESSEVPAEDSVESDESDDDDAQPHEEPINRGLLLKFLSSVRN